MILLMDHWSFYYPAMTQFLMTASYLDIALKELKVAQTAQVNHLFQPLLPLIYNVEASV